MHHVVPSVVSATTELEERAALTKLANCAEIEAVLLGTSRHPEVTEQLRVGAVGPLHGKEKSGAFEQTDVLHLEKQGSIVWSVLETFTSDAGRPREWDVKIDAVQCGLVSFASFCSRWLWVAFALLWLGVGLIDQGPFSQSRENIRSTILLLVVVPALLFTWINRSTEHVLVKAVLRPYRRILWLSASVIDTLFARLAGDVRSEANYVSTGGTPTGYELALFKGLLESK